MVYNVYNGYYKVMSNIPKMGHLPTPDQILPKNQTPVKLITSVLLRVAHEATTHECPRSVPAPEIVAKL